MGSVLSLQEFYELFKQYRRSARRLENRESYDVPSERKWIARFLAGQPRDPEYEVMKRSWIGTVRAGIERGARMERVRVVPGSLTPYLRYEVRGNRGNAEAGEDIRYLPRARAHELDLPDHDFWVFDTEILVLMRFTGDDRPLPHEVVTDPELIARHEAWIDLAMQHATPYAEYLAQDPTREDPPPGAA